MKKTKKAVNVEKNQKVLKQNKANAEKRSNRELVLQELQSKPLTADNMLPDGIVMFPMTCRDVDLLMRIMRVATINHSPTDAIQTTIKTNEDGSFVMENDRPVKEERVVTTTPLITRLINDLRQRLDAPLAKAIDEGIILPTAATQDAWEAFYKQNQQVIDKLNKGDKDALVQEKDIEDFAKEVEDGTITDYPENPIEKLGEAAKTMALETAYKGE